MITAYRVFRISNNHLPTTLFHAWNGSRELPLHTHLHAHVRPVTNPGGGALFLSGWHVAPDQAGLDQYLKRFTRPEELVKCRVFVDGVREKPRSKVLLVDVMRIQAADWYRGVADCIHPYVGPARAFALHLISRMM